jgi:alpha-1,2-mannosyltransferase
MALLRDAPWLTKDRVRAYATLLVLALAAISGWALTGHGISDPANRPIGTDFTSFWTVSWALLNGHEHAVYSPEALAGLERAVVEGESGTFFAWQYPPIALLIVYPLAFLPYFYSLALWLAVGTASYLSALWCILPRPLTLWAGFAYPAVMVTFSHGQNALLATGLLGWGLLLLPRWPVAAGVLFAILGFKPQISLLIPVALIAGGQWRAIIAAGLTFLGLSTATILLFGTSVWAEFLDGLPLTGEILDAGLVPYYKMQSVFAAVRLLGGNPTAAWVVQALATIAVATILIWSWRHSTTWLMKNAALAAAIPLATPFFLDYDLMVVALAMAWLVRAQQQDCALPCEGTALTISALTPLVSRTIGGYAHVPLTPIAVTALLAVVIIRIRQTRGPLTVTLPSTRLSGKSGNRCGVPRHSPGALAIASGANAPALGATRQLFVAPRFRRLFSRPVRRGGRRCRRL